MKLFRLLRESTSRSSSWSSWAWTALSSVSKLLSPSSWAHSCSSKTSIWCEWLLLLSWLSWWVELWSILHRWKLFRRVLLSHRILVIILNSRPCFVSWGHYFGVHSKGGVEGSSEALNWLVISLTNVVHLRICCRLNFWFSDAGSWSFWGLCYRYFHFIFLRGVLPLFNLSLRLFWGILLRLPSFKLQFKLIRFLLRLLNGKWGHFRPFFALWSITVKSIWLLIRYHFVFPTLALRWAWLIFE